MTPPKPATSRRLLHTRRIVCTGYQRDDDLFDMEAEMQDISPNGTELHHRDVEAGGSIHHMRLCLTLDERLTIHAARAFIVESPTPYCPAIENAYAALVGLRIGPGFTQQVKSLFSGTRGCTHLSELLGPLASAAFQTLYALYREKHGTALLLPDTPVVPKPAVINSCHVLHEDGVTALRLWPLERRPTREEPPATPENG